MKFETFENESPRTTIINILKVKKIENPETQLLLQAYEESTGLADTELSLHMVDVYLESGHTKQALNVLSHLEETHEDAEFKANIETVRRQIIEKLL